MDPAQSEAKSGGAEQSPSGGAEGEEKANEVDLRSIYVKNVEYKVDSNMLKEHFASCGGITRVTIKRDPMTGHPLG